MTSPPCYFWESKKKNGKFLKSCGVQNVSLVKNAPILQTWWSDQTPWSNANYLCSSIIQQTIDKIPESCIMIICEVERSKIHKYIRTKRIPCWILGNSSWELPHVRDQHRGLLTPRWVPGTKKSRKRDEERNKKYSLMCEDSLNSKELVFICKYSKVHIYMNNHAYMIYQQLWKSFHCHVTMLLHSYDFSRWICTWQVP